MPNKCCDTDLNGLTIEDVTLIDPRIINPTISGGTANNTTFTDCNYEGETLEGVRISGSEIDRSDFDRGNITNSTFSGNTYTNETLDNVTVSNSTIDRSNVTSSTFSGNTYTNEVLNNVTIFNSLVDRSIIDRSNVTSSTFSGNTYTNEVLNNVRVLNSEILHSAIVGGTMTDTVLNNITLNNPNFTGATVFDDVTLEDATINNPEIIGGELNGTRLTNVQIGVDCDDMPVIVGQCDQMPRLAMCHDLDSLREVLETQIGAGGGVRLDGCDGLPLPAGTQVVRCSEIINVDGLTYDPDTFVLTLTQDNGPTYSTTIIGGGGGGGLVLVDCEGQAIGNGDAVASCDDLDTAVTNIDNRLTIMEGDIINAGKLHPYIALPIPPQGPPAITYNMDGAIAIGREARVGVGPDLSPLGMASIALGWRATVENFNSVAIGAEAYVSSFGTVALGAAARIFPPQTPTDENKAQSCVALGSSSIIVQNDLLPPSPEYPLANFNIVPVVSVGISSHAATQSGLQPMRRRIINVYEGIHGKDAVNLDQLNAVGIGFIQGVQIGGGTSITYEFHRPDSTPTDPKLAGFIEVPSYHAPYDLRDCNNDPLPTVPSVPVGGYEPPKLVTCGHLDTVLEAVTIDSITFNNTTRILTVEMTDGVTSHTVTIPAGGGGGTSQELTNCSGAVLATGTAVVSCAELGGQIGTYITNNITSITNNVIQNAITETTTAPATSTGTELPTTMFGSRSQVLGTPVNWVRVRVGSFYYVLPAYAKIPV